MIEEIRAHCKNLHEKLHRHPLLAALGGGPLDMLRYVSILNAFHTVYDGLEKNRTVAPAAVMPAGIPDAPALDWLNADIDRHRVAGMEIAQPSLPALDSVSALFGYLYVKQGSTLGGQVISKHLADGLGLKPGQDNKFFYGYGAATGANWKSFVNGFELAAPGLDMNEAKTSALAIFNAIDEACSSALAKEQER